MELNSTFFSELDIKASQILFDIILGAFGGATSMTPFQFEQVNGYSNQFWGWGGEDDDMGHRVKSKFKITGYHDKFSRYLMKIELNNF